MKQAKYLTYMSQKKMHKNLLMVVTHIQNLILAQAQDVAHGGNEELDAIFKVC